MVLPRARRPPRRRAAERTALLATMSATRGIFSGSTGRYQIRVGLVSVGRMGVLGVGLGRKHGLASTETQGSDPVVSGFGAIDRLLGANSLATAEIARLPPHRLIARVVRVSVGNGHEAIDRTLVVVQALVPSGPGATDRTLTEGVPAMAGIGLRLVVQVFATSGPAGIARGAIVRHTGATGRVQTVPALEPSVRVATVRASTVVPVMAGIGLRPSVRVATVRASTVVPVIAGIGLRPVGPAVIGRILAVVPVIAGIGLRPVFPVVIGRILAVVVGRELVANAEVLLVAARVTAVIGLGPIGRGLVPVDPPSEMARGAIVPSLTRGARVIAQRGHRVGVRIPLVEVTRVRGEGPVRAETEVIVPARAADSVVHGRTSVDALIALLGASAPDWEATGLGRGSLDGRQAIRLDSMLNVLDMTVPGALIESEIAATVRAFVVIVIVPDSKMGVAGPARAEVIVCSRGPIAQSDSPTGLDSAPIGRALASGSGPTASLDLPMLPGSRIALQWMTSTGTFGGAKVPDLVGSGLAGSASQPRRPSLAGPRLPRPSSLARRAGCDAPRKKFVESSSR